MLERLRAARSGHLFMPPSEQGTIIYPGFDGGAEWGGSAFDPERDASSSTRTRWPGSCVSSASRRKHGEPGAIGAAHLSGLLRHLPRRRSRGQPAAQRAVAERSREPAGAQRRPRHRAEGQGRDARLCDAARSRARRSRRLPVQRCATAAHGGTGRRPVGRTSSSRTPATTASSIREGYPAVRPPWGTLNAIDLESRRDRLAGAARRASGAAPSAACR